MGGAYYQVGAETLPQLGRKITELLIEASQWPLVIDNQMFIGTIQEYEREFIDKNDDLTEKEKEDEKTELRQWLALQEKKDKNYKINFIATWHAHT